MDSTTASRMVLVSGGLLATYVMIEAKRQGKPSEETYKSLWAIGALTVGLSVFADFVPKVAGPFALLVIAAMVARNTGTLGNVIGGVGTQPRTSPQQIQPGTRSSSAARRPETIRGGN